MADELWSEVHDVIQEIGIKTIPRKRNAKNQNEQSEEALKKAVNRREVKAKEKKKDLCI